MKILAFLSETLRMIKNTVYSIWNMIYSTWNTAYIVFSRYISLRCQNTSCAVVRCQNTSVKPAWVWYVVDATRATPCTLATPIVFHCGVLSLDKRMEYRVTGPNGSCCSNRVLWNTNSSDRMMVWPNGVAK